MQNRAEGVTESGGEVIHLSGQGIGYRATLPSYLHGWSFLSLIVAQDDEALAFKAWAAPQGPAIVVNPMFVSPEDLESPSKAILWLCAALTHISHIALIEAIQSDDGFGRFKSESWSEFRKAAGRHSGMDWNEIVASARREGIDFVSEHIAACLFVESGIQHRLLERAEGRPSLRIA